MLAGDGPLVDNRLDESGVGEFLDVMVEVLVLAGRLSWPVELLFAFVGFVLTG